LSVILDTPVLRTKEITKSEHVEPKTSSILLISVAITMAILLLMFTGLTYTEAGYEQYSICRDKIIGFEQSGLYKSTADFRLALSYCDLK
jgi:hypothetical protein